MNSLMPLEDTVGDILQKTLRGKSMSLRELASQAKVSFTEVSGLQKGIYTEDLLRAVAPVLELNPRCLVASSLGTYYPPATALTQVKRFSTPMGEMMVNCFLVWSKNNKAALFDTGTQAQPILTFLFEQKLELEYLFLTHTHDDHCACLPELLANTGARGWVNTLEEDKPSGLREFEQGSEFLLDNLHVTTRLTAGHSRGGTTYVIDGLEQKVAVVGDAIFAGSLGGGIISYESALRGVREQIMTLPPETILLPGHGPETTVASELLHNPFVAL